jgi:hypothetical protein
MRPLTDANHSLAAEIYRERSEFMSRFGGRVPNMLTLHPESYDRLRMESIINWTSADNRMVLTEYQGMEVLMSYDVKTFRVSMGLPK